MEFEEQFVPHAPVVRVMHLSRPLLPAALAQISFPLEDGGPPPRPFRRCEVSVILSPPLPVVFSLFRQVSLLVFPRLLVFYRLLLACDHHVGTAFAVELVALNRPSWAGPQFFSAKRLLPARFQDMRLSRPAFMRIRLPIVLRLGIHAYPVFDSRSLRSRASRLHCLSL